MNELCREAGAEGPSLLDGLPYGNLPAMKDVYLVRKGMPSTRFLRAQSVDPNFTVI